MNKIKKGDDVIVIAGKDKGKRGTVSEVLDDGNKLIVAGVNEVTKCTRPNPNAGIKGGMTKKEMHIQRSNVMLYDPNKKKRSKVGIRPLKDGQRVRYFKASGEAIVDAKS